MNSLKRLYTLCLGSRANFLSVLTRAIYYKAFYNKNIVAHPRTYFTGIRKSKINGTLLIGMNSAGFSPHYEKTFLNIKGKMLVSGNFSIGRGCKIDVGDNGNLVLGKGGYINSNTKLIVMHKLEIGDNCAISWDCQFLDEDFHKITSSGESKMSTNEIYIGNNVWIGCGVKVYKGAYVASGSVVASDSIVKGVFKQKNCLIGGHPARVLKENITWTP